MSNAFKTYKLSELTTILVGGDLPASYSTEKTNLLKIPVYSNGEKENGLYGYTDIAEVTEPAVTISARGSKVGFAALRKEPYLPIVRLISLIPHKEKLDVNFLFYNLKLNRQTGIGSGQPQITIPDISNRTISVPPLSTQQKIASVLSALDDKIELNNRINTELEAMAKTIYDYWFVQFDFPDANGTPYKSSGGKMVYNDVLKREVPEGWEVGTIHSVGDLLGGGTPRKENPEYWNGSIPFFTPKDYEDSFFVEETEDHITKKGLDNCSSKLYPKGTVFITARGTVGNINIASRDMAMNQSCYAVRPRQNINYCFLHQYCVDLIKYMKVKAAGSVFDALVSNDFKLTQAVVPSQETINLFGQRVLCFYEQVLNNKRQNQQLSQLRDWLLPMLMNGQVSVADAYQQEAKSLRMAAEDAAGYGKKR